MNSMTLLKTYSLKIGGKSFHEVSIKSEWNGLIELEALNMGKMIVRRKGWNNGKEWAKEENAFIEQELDVIYADDRFNLPKTEVIFVKPKAKE